MNSTHLITSIALAFGVAASLATAGDGDDGSIAATTFDCSWNTVDGGGGTAAGGAFELSGTIGQPDASAPLSGGAFELVGGFWPAAATINTCPGDIAGTNHHVDVDDLLVVITHWGACANPCPPHCAADIAPAPNGNCSVNVDDLLMVITHWGPCPQ